MPPTCRPVCWALLRLMKLPAIPPNACHTQFFSTWGGRGNLNPESESVNSGYEAASSQRSLCPISIDPPRGLKDPLRQDKVSSFLRCAHMDTAGRPGSQAWSPAPVHSLIYSSCLGRVCVGHWRESGTSRRFMFCGHCNFALSCQPAGTSRRQASDTESPHLCSSGEKSPLNRLTWI